MRRALNKPYNLISLIHRIHWVGSVEWESFRGIEGDREIESECGKMAISPLQIMI